MDEAPEGGSHAAEQAPEPGAGSEDDDLCGGGPVVGVDDGERDVVVLGRL